LERGETFTQDIAGQCYYRIEMSGVRGSSNGRTQDCALSRSLDLQGFAGRKSDYLFCLWDDESAPDGCGAEVLR